MSLTRNQMIEAIKRAEMSPSEKRRALARLNVNTEYMPHQGKREMERRVKKMGFVSNG